MPKFLCVVLLVFMLANQMFAQNNYNLTQFKDEAIDFLKQPAKWENKDWLKLGLASVAAFAIMQTDQSVRTEFMKERSYYKSFPIELGRMYGELYSPLLFAGAFGLNGIFNNDKTSRKIGYEIIQTTIYAGAITTALKFAFGRARPFTEKGSKSFGNKSLFDDSFRAFPSGHTTIAFSISTVLAKNSESNLVKVLCYVPAILTAFSRVYQDKHWVSDVFFGGLIGYTVGSWVTSTHYEKELLQVGAPEQISIVIPIN
ncbi:MAG: phosphoesterase PA-phosphatase-like protein [Ignavibacteria bacterium]|nr:MAG: phosphoesterase PA-phosphatase-like protein [Ignavibacteria bacterium]KAF0160658.1 MAG: phosphoesterase PA-phosphatase-like protein [Ignavibacteria bacterium]